MSLAQVLDETYRVAWGDLVYIKGNLPEVLVTSLVGPLLYLLAFGFGIGGSVSSDPDAYMAFIVPGIVALTTLSATFSTVSMKVLIQRLFYMSFDELLLCPVHISAIVLGKCMSGVVRGLLSCSLLMVVGHIISPEVSLEPLALLVVVAASLMFSLLGLLAGMVTNKTQRLNMFSSLVIVPMTFLCGTLFSVDSLPSVASWVVYALPLTHVSSLMRGIMLDTGIPLDSVLILAAYLVALFAVCWWMIKTNRCRFSHHFFRGAAAPTLRQVLRVRRQHYVRPSDGPSHGPVRPHGHARHRQVDPLRRAPRPRIRRGGRQGFHPGERPARRVRRGEGHLRGGPGRPQRCPGAPAGVR